MCYEVEVIEEEVENDLKCFDITTEKWREYEFPIDDGNTFITYRITKPVELYIGTTTHRVVDKKGVVHCVPAPGHRGCVLRWKTKSDYSPVKF